MLYSIKAVCRQLGLKETTLRAWEERYGAVQPIRKSNNRRFYTEDDLKKVSLLIQAKSLGHPISELAVMSIITLESLLQAPVASNKIEIQSIVGQGGKLRTPTVVFKQILELLENFDLLSIQNELDRIRDMLGTRPYILEFLVPFFVIVNKRVESGKLSVPKEHALSCLIKMQLVRDLYASQQFNATHLAPSPKRLRIATATFDGDTHEFGILMAANLCSIEGHIIYYFGASVPTMACAEAASTTRSHILLLSAPKISFNLLPQLPSESLRQLSKSLPFTTQIWIGGGSLEALNLSIIPQVLREFRSLDALYKFISKEAPIILGSSVKMGALWDAFGLLA